MERGPAGRVVIVGAGLGGLAAAISLRDIGRDVIVLERRAELGEVETGLTLWPFAIRALERLGLGLESQIAEIGAPFDRLRSLSAAGELLSDLDLSPAARLVGAPCFDIDRAQLQAALAARLGPHHIRFGACCVGAAEEDGAPVALLADGAKVKGSILVGADGVHSVVRGFVAGQGRTRPGRFQVWRGVAEVDDGCVPAGVHIRLYGPEAVFGTARLDDARARWYAGTQARRESMGADSELRDCFGAWAEPASRLIEASEQGGVLFNDTPRIVPLRQWARGRVALLGDAAHAAVPTLGVSGGLALADAVALGAALGTGRSDAAALEAYARERGPIGRRVQRAALAFGQVLAVRSPLVGLRNRILSPPFVGFQRHGVGWLMRGAQTALPVQPSSTVARR